MIVDKVILPECYKVLGTQIKKYGINDSFGLYIAFWENPDLNNREFIFDIYLKSNINESYYFYIEIPLDEEIAKSIYLIKEMVDKLIDHSEQLIYNQYPMQFFMSKSREELLELDNLEELCLKLSNQDRMKILTKLL